MKRCVFSGALGALILANATVASAQVSATPAELPSGAAGSGVAPAPDTSAAAPAAASAESAAPADSAAADPFEGGAAAAGASAVPAPESSAPEDQKSPAVNDDAAKAVEDAPESEEPEPKVDPNLLPFTHHVTHFDAGMGARLGWAPDDGLAPFMEDSFRPAFIARVGAAFGVAPRLALAGLLEIGAQSSRANAREIPTSLNTTTLSLGVEARYHFHHRFFGYARVAPGFEFVGGTFEMPAGDDMSDKSTKFMADASLGTAVRFGQSDGSRRAVRVWYFLEGGYHFAAKHSLELEYEDGEGPSRAESIVLDPFTTSGALISTGLFVSY